MISKKVILIGDYSTGKTSLIRRYVDNQFSDTYLSTLGVKISRKNTPTSKVEVQNLIWDVEGGTETKPVNRAYLQGAHGAIIVADVTREETLHNIGNYLELVHSVCHEIPIVIALNKSDLLEASQLQELLERTRERFESRYACFVTSAKTAEAVETLFVTLAAKMTE